MEYRTATGVGDGDVHACLGEVARWAKLQAVQSSFSWYSILMSIDQIAPAALNLPLR